MSVGPAYNLALVAARQGCVGCSDNLTKNILVDSKPFKDAVKQNDLFEIVVDTTTGFMLSQNKALTVFLSIDSNGTLPLPSLDLLKGTLIPLYDVAESMAID